MCEKTRCFGNELKLRFLKAFLQNFLNGYVSVKPVLLLEKLKGFLLCWHLLVQTQQWKHQNKVGNLFKVNNEKRHLGQHH